MRKPEYKPLLYTTTVRNPARVKALLYILQQYNQQELTDNLAKDIVANLIRHGLYRPLNASEQVKEKWASSNKGSFARELLTLEEVERLMIDNPQNHKEAGFTKGWASRFATIFDFAKELGFVFYNINERIEFSDNGKRLASSFEVSYDNNLIIENSVHPEYEQEAFLQAFVKSQRKNPFVRVLNDNVPLVLLLQVLKRLNDNKDNLTKDGKTKGISRRELPLLIFWKDNDADALYKRIMRLRKEFGYEPSDEVICEICTNEIMEGFKEFKAKSIMVEYPDEFIRKMRITGLFSLRGGGRFLDVNYNEKQKIDYILANYSHYQQYDDAYEYFNYMATTDPYLQSASVVIERKQAEILLQQWLLVFGWEKIKAELSILSNRGKSKDEILKLLPAPVRLEFLAALGIKAQFPNISVIPSYSCDDEGLPTSTAAGGKADIVCLEGSNGILIEVTMAEGRRQTIMEVWPISRHLEEFIKEVKLPSQAIFIAPAIFKDSLRQIDFVKCTESLEIRPYEIKDFVSFLEYSDILYQ